MVPEIQVDRGTFTELFRLSYGGQRPPAGVEPAHPT